MPARFVSRCQTFNVVKSFKVFERIQSHKSSRASRKFFKEIEYDAAHKENSFGKPRVIVVDFDFAVQNCETAPRDIIKVIHSAYR